VAAGALAEYAETSATRGVRAWAGSWWDLPATAGDEIAPLLGAPGARCRCHRTSPTASAVLLSSLSYDVNVRDVVVDYRPGVGIRLSPHFYTEDAELDRAFDAIDEIRRTAARRKWLDHPALVT
jgi:kynureninase